MRTLIRHWPAAVLIAVLSGGTVGFAAYALGPLDVHIGLTAQSAFVAKMPIHCPPHLPFCPPSSTPGPTPITMPSVPEPSTFPQQPPPPPRVPAPPTAPAPPPTVPRVATLPLLTVDVQIPQTDTMAPPVTTISPPPTSRAVAARPSVPRTTSSSVFGNPLGVFALVVAVIVVGIVVGKAATDRRGS